MDPQYERLNERLEPPGDLIAPGSQDGGQYESYQVERLAALAHQLRNAPQLRVDAYFASTLEQRLQQRALTQQQSTARLKTARRFWQQRSMLAAIIVLGLLLVLGIGGFVQALRITHGVNPITAIIQRGYSATPMPTAISTSTSDADQAALDLQTARARLNTLVTLDSPVQTNAYVQALGQFDDQLTRATNTINALPAGTHKTYLMGQITLLKSEARQKLRGLLRKLTSTASLATTSELGQLGDTIPRISSATIIMPAHPKGIATIRIAGSDIQPGAQLLIDGTPANVTGTLQSGEMVFTLTWKSEKRPGSLGIVNADGTVTQTSNIVVVTSKEGNGNSHGNSHGNGHGNGHG